MKLQKVFQLIDSRIAAIDHLLALTMYRQEHKKLWEQLTAERETLFSERCTIGGEFGFPEEDDRTR